LFTVGAYLPSDDTISYFSSSITVPALPNVAVTVSFMATSQDSLFTISPELIYDPSEGYWVVSTTYYDVGQSPSSSQSVSVSPGDVIEFVIKSTSSGGSVEQEASIFGYDQTYIALINSNTLNFASVRITVAEGFEDPNGDWGVSFSPMSLQYIDNSNPVLNWDTYTNPNGGYHVVISTTPNLSFTFDVTQ
jgi:hypothetical protein